MTALLPLVFSKPALPRAILYTWPLQQPQKRLNIFLDTPPWFHFLAQERPFRFTYHLPQGGTLKLTIRPQKRVSGTYWLASKSINGLTTQHYLAPSATLTKAKLDAVGQLFFDLIPSQTADEPTQPLYAALDHLSGLVQRLIDHCSQPALGQHAQRELARIHQQLAQAPSAPTARLAEPLAKGGDLFFDTTD
jgi:hypothetical protein